MENLGDSHMLYRIILAVPTGRHRLRAVEPEIAKSKKVKDATRVAFNLNVFHNDKLRKVFAEHNKLRMAFHAMSSPWDESGYRLVKNEKTAELDRLINDTKLNAEALWADFLSTYDTDRVKDKDVLGDLYKEIEWATVEELKSKHRVEVDTMQVPSPMEDVRSGWTEEQKERYNKSMAKKRDKALKLNMIEAVGKIKERLVRASDRLDKYTGAKDGSFKDITITGFREVIQAIRDVNVINDKEVNSIIDDIEKELFTLNPAELRKSPVKRQMAKKEIDRITDRLGALNVDMPE